MTKPIYFYNSIKGEKELFQPEDPQNVKIYSCGPTVYNYNHIGNFRSYVFVDTLRRTLKLFGYTLNQTMNITDIDDKIINQSIEKGITIEEFTAPWISIFFEDLKTLHIDPVEHYPKATDSIEEMLHIIENLKENDFVYEKEGSIYYSISKFESYGKLSKIDTKGMKSGARYDADEYTKDDLRDFVLWKAPKVKGEKSWNSSFGEGRPGWHLECSAMIRKVYKSGIDIHTGGIDLLFPHHENEIAQSEGAFPRETFVKNWLHCEHLLVEGQKMSKSLGNYYTLRDLLAKDYNPKAIRYLLLSFHYRTKLNFSLGRLEEASKSITRIQTTLDRILELRPSPLEISEPKNYAKESYEEFLNGLGEDLNTPKALGSLFEFLKTINHSLDEGSLKSEDLDDILSYFQKINLFLDVLQFENSQTIEDNEIESLIEKRVEARKNKDFKTSDEIRDLLFKKGILLEDTKTGMKWKRK
jgi:cysteinyl-tRNA synthetase